MGDVTNLTGTIRRATTGDLEAVLEIDRATPIGRERRELLTDRVNSGDVIVYEERGRALGYATMTSRRSSGEISWRCSPWSRRFVVTGGDRVSGSRRWVASLRPTGSSPRRINPMRPPMIALLRTTGWEYSGAHLTGSTSSAISELVYYRNSQ